MGIGCESHHRDIGNWRWRFSHKLMERLHSGWWGRGNSQRGILDWLKETLFLLSDLSCLVDLSHIWNDWGCESRRKRHWETKNCQMHWWTQIGSKQWNLHSHFSDLSSSFLSSLIFSGLLLSQFLCCILLAQVVWLNCAGLLKASSFLSELGGSFNINSTGHRSQLGILCALETWVLHKVIYIVLNCFPAAGHRGVMYNYVKFCNHWRRSTASCC